MTNTNDAARLLDTIMSIPGMMESVKIDLKISRKNVLLLSSVIESGLPGSERTDNAMLSGLPKEAITELKGIADDCLQKAGLKELSEKLKLLNGLFLFSDKTCSAGNGFSPPFC